MIRFHGAPNDAGRCPVVQCYDKIWAYWRNSKITWANIVNAVLDAGTKILIMLPILNVVGTVKNTLAQP